MHLVSKYKNLHPQKKNRSVRDHSHVTPCSNCISPVVSKLHPRSTLNRTTVTIRAITDNPKSAPKIIVTIELSPFLQEKKFLEHMKIFKFSKFLV